MAQQIYSIQLLNDLHNHFPEILYNPGRFQNVQDLLAYIRNVASASPYDRGLQQFNSRNNNIGNRQNGTTVPSYRPPVAPAPVAPAPPTPAEMNRLYSLPVNSTVPQAYVATTVFEDNLPQTRVRMPVNTNTNVLMNTLLGGLFGDIMGGGINLNNFLNERVPVYPTNEEINNATMAYRASHRHDDICAICQEDIDNGQEVRRIRHCNHYFHQDCIDTWFHTNVHCPTCRHDIREVNVNQQPNRNNDNPNDRLNRQNTNPPPVPDNHRRTNIRGDN